MPARSRQPAPAAPSPQAPRRAPAVAGPSNAQQQGRLAQPNLGDQLRGAVQTGGQVLQRVVGQGRGDIEREGTFTDPQSRGAVPVDKAFAEAKAQGKSFGAWLMERYAFQPKGEKTTPAGDATLRIFSPGLNTPEPKATPRTAYYADKLGQPMVHLHNGSNDDAGFANADKIDYATALAVRSGLKSTPLLGSLVTLLKAALSGAEPQDVHAILYSDSTIAGSRAIAIVRKQMIESRQRKGMPADKAEAEVNRLLEKHLFVEMHGNVAADLPQGPRYVLWTDQSDTITHNRPHPRLPEMGFSGSHRDRDANALYIDYDGPFGGADAHNLESNGVHAVRQTWAANGVSSSQALFDKHSRGEGITVPSKITGDASRLWNPRNDPNWGKKKK